MTRLLPLLLLALVFAAGCRTAPEPIPDMPDAPRIVRVPVTEYVVPDWLVKRLPEDAPRANTVEEATRLACVRLGTIQMANCRFALGRRLDEGLPVADDEIEACAALAASRCEVRP